MRALLDLVAGTRCVACGTAGDDLCTACADDVAVIRPACDRCGSPTTTCGCWDLAGFARARSLVAFHEPARALTLAMKRRGRRTIVDSIGSLLARLAMRDGLYTGSELVTFVPAGRAARRKGFDHGELLARATAEHLGTSVGRILLRAHEGPRQADVALSERRHNVRERFAARPSDGRVLLVDDVFTTGATAEACALAIANGGASNVDVVTWARTLRRRRHR